LGPRAIRRLDRWGLVVEGVNDEIAQVTITKSFMFRSETTNTIQHASIINSFLIGLNLLIFVINTFDDQPPTIDVAE